MSVNKVILVGRLGRDPETRFTGGGQAVANFSLATDETYTDKNCERQKRTECHKITVWGKQAEIAQQYLKKGSLVYVEGRIQTRNGRIRKGRSAPATTSWPTISACWVAAPTALRREPAPAHHRTAAVSQAEAVQRMLIWKADLRARNPLLTVRKFPTKTYRSKSISLPRNIRRPRPWGNGFACEGITISSHAKCYTATWQSAAALRRYSSSPNQRNNLSGRLPKFSPENNTSFPIPQSGCSVKLVAGLPGWTASARKRDARQDPR